MIKSVLITGANAGLGKECARQLGTQPETTKVYLGCRNPERAEAAKLELEETTGRKVFEIIIVDVSSPDSVRAAVEAIPEPIDALVMNAGGMGGTDPGQLTESGAIQLFATNLLGHTILLEELLAAKKLTQVALFAGTEAARGIPTMRMKRPTLETSSVDDFVSICDGTFFPQPVEAMVAYGPVKYMSAMCMAAIARKHPEIRVITVSPGGTDGTEVMNDLPPLTKFFFTHVGLRILPLLGMMHDLDVGAKRYVDALNDKAYTTGAFYGSAENLLTGPMIDQATIFEDLNNEAFQDNAYEAVHRFIS